MITGGTYEALEYDLVKQIVRMPDYTTKHTLECFGTGFVLLNPLNNKNARSNYEYADAFFEWMMSGQKDLSQKLIEMNPWVKRFVDTAGLPDNFSASYAPKIAGQMNTVLHELITRPESRRAYINILYPTDQVILNAKTTHEYPCTIGIQLFVRNNRLHMIVNMRSNNVWSVMPYDVYNFTRLQAYIAEKVECSIGHYYHQINNAHIFHGDVRRIQESNFLNT